MSKWDFWQLVVIGLRTLKLELRRFLTTLEDHQQVGRDAAMVPTSASAKFYQRAAERKWAVEKVQRKVIRKQELAILYRRIGYLLEEEADMLNEEAPGIARGSTNLFRTQHRGFRADHLQWVLKNWVHHT
jgi:hypothetical protein